jgi:hypothetical protein
MQTTKSTKSKGKKTAKKANLTFSPAGLIARKKLELAVKDVNKRLKNLVDLHYFEE